MKRVMVVFLVFALGMSLLSLACGTAAPTASKAIGASPGAPAATSTPAAALVPSGAPTATPAPAEPPPPAAALATAAPSFEEMLATRENEALTSAQQRDFIESLVGRRVVDWRGVVTDAELFLGLPMVYVDLPGGAERDLLFTPSREELADFNKQEAIKVSGRIKRVETTLGSFILSLDEVTYALGEGPPTHTPPPTSTQAPISTPGPTNTLAPTGAAGPTSTAAAPGAAGATVSSSNANLRGGPGTNFPVVGSVAANTPLQIVGRNAAGDWYLLSSGQWIAAMLVNGKPDLPVAGAIPTPTAAPQPTTAPSPVPQHQAASFGFGLKVVGTDVAPGTYRSPGGANCYWERLSGFGGTLDEILAKDNAAGPVIVTIARTDKGFNSAGCNGWTADLSPITSGPTAPFGDGTFLVNKDIAPGSWRSSGGGNCTWERLSGFSGALSDIIAHDHERGPTVVTIGSGDAGFSSSGCGTWTQMQ